MTPDEFQQIRVLFERAIDEAPADLQAWLAREATSPAVAAEVSSLLAHHSRAGSFLTGTFIERHPDLLDDGNAVPAGTLVGHYTIVRELGRGGMGRVYLATDLRLGRTVALKALPPVLTRDTAQRERLRREARSAALLTHPGICTVFALEEIDGDLFIVSEFVDGRTLREEIASSEVPSARDVLRTAVELADALGSAHARGVTHRDLKPENVMRTKDGRLKILDFGLALTVPTQPRSPASPRVTQPGTFVGTPAYMAPEQLTGGQASPQSDLFALGVLLYEFATGVHPFQADTALAMAARVIEGVPRPISELRPDVSGAFALAVERCLGKAPERRFTSATEFARALTVEATPDYTIGFVTPWWRRHQLIAVVLYAIACGAAWQIKEWLHGVTDPLFLLVSIGAVVAGVFRGHMLFTEQMNRSLFPLERQRSQPITMTLDLIISCALAVDGLMVFSKRPLAAVLTIGLAAGLALARILVEPATTRAAFGDAR